MHRLVTLAGKCIVVLMQIVSEECNSQASEVASKESNRWLKYLYMAITFRCNFCVDIFDCDYVPWTQMQRNIKAMYNGYIVIACKYYLAVQSGL